MPKQQTKKKGRKGYLCQQDRQYAISFSQRKYDTQLDRFGAKLDPGQDGLITKPSRRASRHKRQLCHQCGKDFKASYLEKHKLICGREKRQCQGNEAKLKQLRGTRTWLAQQKWFKVLVDDHGWRSFYAAQALLEKPPKETYSRYVRRIAPNRERANVYFKPEQDSSKEDEAEEENSSAE